MKILSRWGNQVEAILKLFLLKFKYYIFSPDSILLSVFTFNDLCFTKYSKIFALQFIGACKDPLMVIVTELLPGMSLRKYLMSNRKQQLDPRLAINFALDIARAMDCLHANGIIHRDLKPGMVSSVTVYLLLLVREHVVELSIISICNVELSYPRRFCSHSLECLGRFGLTC